MGCNESKPGGGDEDKPPNSLPGISFNPDEETESVPKKLQSTEKVVMRALYPFDKIQLDDVSFKKGDRLELQEGNYGEEVWYFAKNIQTGECGYIPSNYVVIDDNKPESQEWFFPIERREAEKQLLKPVLKRGTFLIRPSNGGNNKARPSYALSIQDIDEKQSNRPAIKHYRLRLMDNGFECYINHTMVFHSPQDLIHHYSEKSDGLCCRLTISCPRELQPFPFKYLEVDRDQIKLQGKLGQGVFGEVFRATWCQQVAVAVKTLKEGQMSRNDFLEEAKVMHKLIHPKLVQLMGVCTIADPLYIITELMVNGSLVDYLRQDGGVTLRCGNLIDMAAQIADGMNYLEVKKFIHRDLRAANILVGTNNTVKVADFGLARHMICDTGDDFIYTSRDVTKFPIKWTAPEAAFERLFTTKSDVWSYGVLLHEIFTFGRLPYPGMTGQEVLRKILDNYRMPKPNHERVECPIATYDKMLECWNIKPEARPTFSHLYSFFDDFMNTSDSQYR